MDHIINVRMSFEDLVKIFLLPDVHFHKLGTFSSDEFNATEDLFARIVKVITYNNLIISFEERKGGEGANVAGPTVIRSVKV